jgi:RNA polymerase sigma-70 factor, ECF subfamily
MPSGTVATAEPEAALALRIVHARPGRDPQAEAALYRSLAPRVRLYGRRHLRDDAAAEDLMQHVMLMTIEKLRAGTLREPERVVSFVFGTCRMTVLELRRGALRRDELLQTFGADLAPGEVDPAREYEPEAVARCLERLSERERSVVVLTFFDDSPADAVARSIGVSAGNVRVIRHRALQRLRSCVTGEAA